MQGDLSIRGVARRCCGYTGVFTIRGDFCRSRDCSVRATLEPLIRAEYSWLYAGCIYVGAAAFEQTWAHIVVRIKLDWDDGIPAATKDDCKARWKRGIEGTWNNRWGIARQDELRCKLTFEVQWVTKNEHHEVSVGKDAEREDEYNWTIYSDERTAAHEFGHMLGLVDEYPNDGVAGSVCPDRFVDERTIMGKGFDIPARMMQRFASNMKTNVV